MPAGACGSSSEGFDGGYASCCCHCRSPLCCQCQHVGGGGTPLEPAPRWDGPLRLASTRRPDGGRAVCTRYLLVVQAFARAVPATSQVAIVTCGAGHAEGWGGGGQDWRPLAITARGVWPARARAVARQATRRSRRPERLVCHGTATRQDWRRTGGCHHTVTLQLWQEVGRGVSGGRTRVAVAALVGALLCHFLLQEKRWLGLAVRAQRRADDCR